MGGADCKAFIVEGEAREPLILANISKIFFSHGNFKIITLPAGENIYMLWKKLAADDFDTDIIEVIRENSKENRIQLEGLTRNDFSEIYLFFDYDAHQTNLHSEKAADAVSQMLACFDNETENGKLYISYPMVEALRDFMPGICGDGEHCFIEASDFAAYKTTSAARAYNANFKEYDFELWKEQIAVFAMRISCLFERCQTFSYEEYSVSTNPLQVYIREEQEFQKDRVLILSAFPEFLVDYFGKKLWTRCVSLMKNQRDILQCR